jgi:hypothetical protein
MKSSQRLTLCLYQALLVVVPKDILTRNTGPDEQMLLELVLFRVLGMANKYVDL